MPAHVYVVLRHEPYVSGTVLGIYADDLAAIEQALADARPHATIPYRWVVERWTIGQPDAIVRVWEANTVPYYARGLDPVLLYGFIGGPVRREVVPQPETGDN